ncbi:MAG: TolB protein [Actinomycetota bacterium]|nr:TolB protein [Actinomycetota bacterium]
MSELKELLEREARRVDADPGALESVYRTRERRQRDRRIGTAIFAFAVFAAVIALISGALGLDRSFPADQTPGALPHNGDIVVRADVGNDKGAILQIDPATSKEVALPVAASAKDLVWPVMGSEKNMTDLSSSPDGTALAYVWSNDVWVLDIASGVSRKIVNPCGRMCTVAWSPDGSTIAFTHGDTLELVNPQGGGRRTVTTFPGISAPMWSPDGQRIAFLTQGGLYTIDQDGSGLHSLGVNAWDAAWSPDGSRIAYLSSTTDCNAQGGCVIALRTVRPDGTNPTEVVRAGRGPFLAFWPGLTWSPDGTQLALVVRGPQGQPLGLYLVNEDGSGLRLLRQGAWGRPAWEPAP